MKTSNRITKRVLVGASAMAAVALTPPAEGATYVDVTYQGLSKEISFAHIGDINNGQDTFNGTVYGDVGYEYYISKYAVTQGQWVDFLNAVATDRSVVDLPANQGIKNLYSPNMAGSNDAYNGIKRTETAGTYSYSLLDEDVYAKRPVVYVTLLSAKRFCNWLTNGGGSTEDGIYNMSAGDNAERTALWGQAGAVALPTENEWYKAAYYDPNKSGGAGYYTYAFGGRNGDTISHDYANYYEGGNVYYNTMGDGFGNRTYYMNEVDFFEGYASAYGAVDMTGNVWEWTDSPHETYTTARVVRGASYTYSASSLAAGSSRPNRFPVAENSTLGFRVASLAPIPEPAEIGVIGGALVGLLCLVRRRRKKA
ncbi:MAG: formylglycine-generating enzyme family protein [Puniceicoccales bacterium]|jgi:formylglycine-generating enzyme required for sulfatase activity|nr:formylglycine-generating enzyme family protein [Puniceicoccales bacterium]